MVIVEIPEISVIIVSLNGRKLLPIVLSSLQKQTYQDFETIVVDNGSTDGSNSFIQNEFPHVTVLKSPKNSFAIANNLGISRARGKYSFFINNDVELDHQCLERLVFEAKNSREGVGMWATKILNYYKRDIIDNTGLQVFMDGLARGRGRLEPDRGQFDKVEEVLCPSGCAGMFLTKILRDAGGFDEDFDFYVEDVDLGFRCRLMGWSCIYVPEAKVYHMYSATGGEYSPRKAFLVERNRLWFSMKDFPVLLVLLLPWTSFLRYCFQVIGVFFHKGAAGKFVEQYSRRKLFAILMRAWLSALVGMPGMLAKRKITRLHNVSWTEELGWFYQFGISVRKISLQD